jgi:competence protein ComEA
MSMLFGHQRSCSSRKAVFLAGMMAFSLAHSAAGADKPKLPDGPGKATTVKVCGICHAAEIVMSRRESLDGWNAVVADMIERGAKASDDEFGEVVDYLAANFPNTAPAGKINVNQASAKELAVGLGISEKQSSAIVQYRESKGKFKSIEDLLRVPEIDAASIAANKNKIEF